MDSLQELLGRYTPQEPDEVAALKTYIAKAYGADATVGLHGETLVVTVASASLANVLRLRMAALKRAANTDKKIILRIG